MIFIKVFLVLGIAEQFAVFEAAEALVLEFRRTQASRGGPRRQGGLSLSHPLHQGAQVTVTLPRVVVDVQLLQVWEESGKDCYLKWIMLASANDAVLSTSTIINHSFAPVKMGWWKGHLLALGLTKHLGEHVSIHCLQAVSTESQLRKLGHVPEHIRWKMIQIVLPQVEFLVQ